MGKSRAQKQRKKVQREGLRNPELNRGQWGQLNPITRMTSTKLGQMRKTENKHKKRFEPQSPDYGQIVFFSLIF